MYVYIKSEPGLWTVGFYHPNGRWESDSDHTSRQEAAERVHYLNGGQPDEDDGPSIAADTKARIKWQEPDGNQGHGAWLSVALARVIAQAYKQGEPRRTVFVEYQSGKMEEVQHEPQRTA